ncbi:glycan biosynthesis hexose transferase WsfD [Gorillibacterium timonense]|uniref:glycan biosynthesis hexose transferase WsfD n=1 Tax=Gorillibacterium timonense TaxID=1689269 RepID=UPI00071D1103|nr:hypothetical protein [Gorillibacterium timonense]
MNNKWLSGRLLPLLKRSETWMLIAAVILYAVLLLRSPVIGVADNGDFARVMGAGGLQYADAGESHEDRYYRYSHASYAFDGFHIGGYASSQLPFLYIAGMAGRLFGGLFDIRVLSALYFAFMAAALVLAVKYGKTRSATANAFLVAALSFVFLDIGYLAYFNSLFGEPVALIFLILTTALAYAIARTEQASSRLLACFYVAAAILACTKIQNAPVGVAFALLGMRFARLKPDKAWRKLAYGGAAVLVCISILMYSVAPGGLKQINLYQTVFYGVLKDSPQPEKDLEALGLPTDLAVLAGTNYFQTGTAIPQDDPRLHREVYDVISHMDILRFYATHPERFLQKLERAAESGMAVRPYYLGNYEKSVGKPPGTLAYTFSAWSEFKRNHLPHTFGFISLVFACYIAVILFHYIRTRDRRLRISLEVFLLIAAVAAFSLAIPILGDGEADLGKHLFLFNVCFDLMLLIMAVYGVRLLLDTGAGAVKRLTK